MDLPVQSANLVVTYSCPLPTVDFPLKYGCNPHQLPANIYRMAGGNLPFKVRQTT